MHMSTVHVYSTSAEVNLFALLVSNVYRSI
jgi:hypothetical protein